MLWEPCVAGSSPVHSFMGGSSVGRATNNFRCVLFRRRVLAVVASLAHNQEVEGSNPSSAPSAEFVGVRRGINPKPSIIAL